MHDEESGDRFVTDGASTIDCSKFKVAPAVDATTALQHSEPIKDLRFVPYYFRANREGKGQMRVGLKAASPSAGG